MAYKKIYYDDIWEATNKGSIKCGEWAEQLDALAKSFDDFVKTESFKGEAATNMKNYIAQVHGILSSTILTISQSYKVHAIDYYGGYTRIVDSGDGEEYGLRYTTIVNDEVNSKGTVQKKLDNIQNMAVQVTTDVEAVKKSIADLVTIYSRPVNQNLYDRISMAKRKAQTVHDNAIKYEASREHDFDEIDRLITQALSIIEAQLGDKRIPVIAYQNGAVGTMCNVEQLVVDLEASSKKIQAIVDSKDFEKDANLVINRDELIQQEEEASRQWAQWVAAGIAVVGAIVLTVVTAGGAAPITCAFVGGVVGGVSAASSKFADNYVENGDFTEGMDWSDFGKSVLVGTAGGAASGYLGAISRGSAIKRPIANAGRALRDTAIKEGIEGGAGIIWEVGEGAYEIGDAYINRKPGDNIQSVVLGEIEEAGDEIGDEILATAKDVTVEGAKSFAGGYVSGKFKIDTSDKGIGKKIGEKTVEGIAESVSGGAVDTVWNVGEAVLDNDSSTTVKSAFKQGVKDTVADVAKSTVGAVISEGGSGVSEKITDSIDNKTTKKVVDTAFDAVVDTSESTAKSVVEGVTNRTMDYIYGDEKDASKIFGDVLEEDIKKKGHEIFKDAATSFGKNKAEEAFEDRKHYNELKKIDNDHDGKVEVVQFDDYTVTKQDYDAAVKNAGKFEFKDKTAQDLLGLPKDTDLSSGKERVVKIDYTKKYSYNRKTTDTVTIDGKYTFKKDYYESALNVAGTEEYGGKSAEEILDLPDGVDLSKDEIKFNRVKNDDIGYGKKVELHQDSGTNAQKIHISTINRETRAQREKLKKETK